MEQKTEQILDQSQEDIFLNRCNQTKCSYYLNGGCKNCKECNAKPYNINYGCECCVSCMTIPNNLRFELDEKEQEKIINDLKEMISKIKLNNSV
jgi:hypothetical protein